MNALTDLQRDVLDRGLFDFVGLWEVVATVSATRPDPSADDVLDTCLGAIRPLIRDSLMEPGEMVDGEFMARQANWRPSSTSFARCTTAI